MVAIVLSHYRHRIVALSHCRHRTIALSHCRHRTIALSPSCYRITYGSIIPESYYWGYFPDDGCQCRCESCEYREYAAGWCHRFYTAYYCCPFYG
ncbi:hypothetical protein DPMN_058811 [Dreissena polymorpha]|uniref:Uncharacterized protein n=1 Tax=Dreissena polymorpha TaxID=45954 RepID=A0A9D4C2R6_DREPO|nr:hypothetical protein DPMN_058811 [Dreissena polymorpha]